ncbi:MAG: hypothetical protein ACO2PN_14370 [Pyrobaculum sp.]
MKRRGDEETATSRGPRPEPPEKAQVQEARPRRRTAQTRRSKLKTGLRRPLGCGPPWRLF